MPQGKIKIRELLSRNTDNVKVEEINKPNLDRMAEAFFKLLVK